jgi:quercetin dioxygenase-like cupin family protein
LAEHILSLAPKSARVIFENETIRVVLTTMKKGQKIPMHSHGKGFSYSLNSGRIRSTGTDGKARAFSVKKGEASWSDEGYAHAVDNLGGSLQELSVEFKDLQSDQWISELDGQHLS